MTIVWSSVRFYFALAIIAGLYVTLTLGMLLADSFYTSREHILDALRSPDIQYAIKLSLVSCFATALLSIWVAVPTGYLLSRTRFWGRPIIETILDIPIVLPPLVIGISLLILFQTPPGKWIENITATRTGFLLTYVALPTLIATMSWPILRRAPWPYSFLYVVTVAAVVVIVLRFSGLGSVIERRLQSEFGTRITFQIPSVIIAQFAVTCAFAIRTMRVTFDQISPRTEDVARTLGCTRGQAFWMVAVPESWRGIVSAGTLAWARALGEFGPILIFAGATRNRTEVLSTTVFLEFSIGRLDAAIAVSLLMVVVAVIALLVMRATGLKGGAV